MLKEILNALRGTDALAEMIDQIAQMLQTGQWMFDQASEVLMREADWTKASDQLYEKDRKINELEQRVRERIVTHLTVGHQADLSACLVLMSIVKDAERIGDYCKNIFEVAKFYKSEYSRKEYATPLEEIRGDVRPLFDVAQKALTTADRDTAYRTLENSRDITKRCDQIIRQLLSVHDQIPPDEAVAYVLLARFYKRVTAHLANIASSVVSPVPMIDFRKPKSSKPTNKSG